jgi:GTP-binding protein
MPKPLVALVGRPNVGKSTLFNRIVGERVAIVEDVAGTTRDRLYFDADWAGREFTVVDTGGLEIEPGSDIAQQVRRQAEEAMAEADVIVFVVDAREGVTPSDRDVAQLLRQTSKPVIVVANKAETSTQRFNAAEFYALGLPEVFTVSAIAGTGTGDFLDAVVAAMPPVEGEPETAEGAVRVALVGRPNVGKSSLFNAIVGRERSIVHDVPGTTRDAIDTVVEFDDTKIVLVDTAGVRRRGRIEVGIEKYSVLRSVRAIERADVVALLIDAAEGVTAQDTHLAGFAASEGKGLVLVVNKWDLISPQTRAARDAFSDHVRSEMKFAPYAPILFVSALKRTGVGEVLATIPRIAESRNKRVPTAELNELIDQAVHAHGPPSDRGRTFRIYYATQATVNPPTFVFFVNDAKLLHFSYQRFLENRIRQAFGFEGTAIRLVFRNRSSAERVMENEKRTGKSEKRKAKNENTRARAGGGK